MAPSTYSHRNGETETPTETGQFWFRGTIGRHDAECQVEVDSKGNIDWWMTTSRLSDAKGQWWGPIMPPWESTDGT